VAVSVSIALKLIRFGAKWYQDNLEPNKDKERLNPVVTLFQRFGYMLVIIVAVSMGLSHFGINVTALSAALIFGALLVGLGAKDIISDAVSGFIILIDQPFRVGDSIELEDLGKVGDVVDIGTRTTHIRTRDNRLVIVPNSAIGGSQVINYSYPDPEYRVQIEIGVAYGSDFDQVRSVIHDTVRGIDGVLPDKPVDALYHVFGDSSRTMRVRWWIDSVKHETRIVDRVSEALEVALDKAGIDLPFNTESLIVQVDPKTIKQLALSRQEPDPAIDQPAAASTPDGRETE
jgi:small-conductance mechanosensitive channel